MPKSITVTDEDVRYMIDRLHSMVFDPEGRHIHMSVNPVEVTKQIREFLIKIGAA